MTIFVYNGLTWNPEIGIAPSEFSPISVDWSKLGIPNLAQMTDVFSKVTECCKIPWLLLGKNQQDREKQGEGGGGLNYPTLLPL